MNTRTKKLALLTKNKKWGKSWEKIKSLQELFKPSLSGKVENIIPIILESQAKIAFKTMTSTNWVRN
jgi:hypothetical protein